MNEKSQDLSAKNMNLSDFGYILSPEYIAQTPCEPRDSSRLLMHRDTGIIEHAIFRDLGRYLNHGDLLVINQTRVIPARIFARKPTGGRVEVLLLRREDATTWEVLVGGKGLRTGRKIKIEAGPGAQILEELGGSRRRIQFSEPIEPYLPVIGQIPLPPYIHQSLSNPERYQTIYAQDAGSAAAPTAGLHFTQPLLDSLVGQGIQLAHVTLHVGLDTFAPVTEDNPSEHLIHSEWCELPLSTVEAVIRTRLAGKKVIAVGTTTVRTLESGARNGDLISFQGNTNLYILPGYPFKIVDAMITNFHLSKSTLLMLVSAFAGREKVLHAYEIAKQAGYRFYSFGDAMLIL
jgi:S-adenosylmethionine:tRNA ribosyltransferase-isomerase